MLVIASLYLLTADETLPLKASLSDKLIVAAWPVLRASIGNSVEEFTGTRSGEILEKPGCFNFRFFESKHFLRGGNSADANDKQANNAGFKVFHWIGYFKRLTTFWQQYICCSFYKRGRICNIYKFFINMQVYSKNNPENKR
ncbi:MAG: hypothetical protein WDO19_09085 [Bacteroidota bacterium]